MPPRAAYVTLLTRHNYLPGALVLHRSLLSVGAQHPLVVMVTPSVGQDVKDILTRRGMVVRMVDQLKPRDGTHSLSVHDARFGDTWTKLRAFELTEYDRVVLLDADMVVMRNMDQLMELELPIESIAAVHVCACNPFKLPHYPSDWVPANCAHTPMLHPTALTSPPKITDASPRPYFLLNSGTVVLNPSAPLFDSIQNFLFTTDISGFKFPDQDLLAAFFKGNWTPLPWCYNALKTLRNIHKAMWRDEEVRCLHYILAEKPWQVRPGAGGDYEELNQWWRKEYEQLRAEMQTADKEGWALVSANVVH